MTFEDFSFDPRIMDGIRDAGYTEPTPIQHQAIPVVLEGRDVLGLAQTGTGKTAAFALPIIQRLTQGPLRQVRALIVAPTRELAEQITQATNGYAKYTKVRAISLYGGVSKRSQASALRRGAEIVVACPGRLLDHVNDGSIDLSHVEVLVLDESDTMCDMGFLPDIRRILNLLPKERQTLFFSATMPNDIRVLADSILHEPVTVQIGMIAPAESVSHVLYPVSQTIKRKFLLELLERMPSGRVLIFTRTKYGARNLASDLEKRRYHVAALQGNMTQNRRNEAINGFRNGKYDILVATNVAARGIDVSDISHVINFDMPDTVDDYTHRIGRTGRVQQTGEAFSLTLPEDEAMVRQIEQVLGARIERRKLPDFDYRVEETERPRQQIRVPSGQVRRRNGYGVSRNGAGAPRTSNGASHNGTDAARSGTNGTSAPQQRPPRRRRPAATESRA